MEFKIVGNYFRSAIEKEVFKNLVVDELLFLEAEPSNEFDENAVKVCCADNDDDFLTGSTYHLGYVPKPSNIEVLGLLEGNKIDRVKYRGNGLAEIVFVEAHVEKEKENNNLFKFPKTVMAEPTQTKINFNNLQPLSALEDDPEIMDWLK